MWDFQPLTTSAKETINAAIKADKVYELVDEYTALLFEDKPIERVMVADGLKKAIGYLAEYAKLAPTDEDDSTSSIVLSEIERASAINTGSNSTFGNSSEPRVEQIISGSVPALTAWPGAGDIIYGFLNGIINVFPRYSLPQLCRGNITTTYSSVNELFV